MRQTESQPVALRITAGNSFHKWKAFRKQPKALRRSIMSPVSAPTKETVLTTGILQEPLPTQKAKSNTVIEHVLSRLKDLGITKVFGVAGDFAFPIEDAIVGFPGIDWVGCCNELNASYAADGYA